MGSLEKSRNTPAVPSVSGPEINLRPTEGIILDRQYHRAGRSGITIDPMPSCQAGKAGTGSQQAGSAKPTTPSPQGHPVAKTSATAGSSSGTPDSPSPRSARASASRQMPHAGVRMKRSADGQAISARRSTADATQDAAPAHLEGMAVSGSGDELGRSPTPDPEVQQLLNEMRGGPTARSGHPAGAESTEEATGSDEGGSREVDASEEGSSSDDGSRSGEDNTDTSEPSSRNAGEESSTSGDSGSEDASDMEESDVKDGVASPPEAPSKPTSSPAEPPHQIDIHKQEKQSGTAQGSSSASGDNETSGVSSSGSSKEDAGDTSCEGSGDTSGSGNTLSTSGSGTDVSGEDGSLHSPEVSEESSSEEDPEESSAVEDSEEKSDEESEEESDYQMTASDELRKRALDPRTPPLRAVSSFRPLTPPGAWLSRYGECRTSVPQRDQPPLGMASLAQRKILCEFVSLLHAARYAQ